MPDSSKDLIGPEATSAYSFGPEKISLTQEYLPRGCSRLFTCLLLFATASFAGSCNAIDSDQRDAIFSYFRQHFRIPERTPLTIIKDSVFNDACYREVIIGSTERTAPLVLYLSPDHRFISASLVDLQIAKQSNRAIQSDETKVKALLLAEASPVRGNETAPLTVVEFGDLECPYCKHLNDWLISLSPDLAFKVRVSYKHLPLPSHPWARAASQIAICAERQSVEAFWKLHDFLLEQQADVTVENLKPKSFDLLRREHVNLQQVESCVDTSEADKIISRDLLLARYLRIDSTPTVFINGEKIPAPQSLDELERAMRAALQSVATVARN